MSRFGTTVLVLSLALNLGFGLAWWGHHRSSVSQLTERTEWRREGRRQVHHEGPSGPHALRRHADGDWAPRRAHRLHRELGLDSQRRERLQTSLEPLEPQIADTRRSLMEARQAFAEALHVDAPDRDAVMTLRNEVSQLQAQLDSLVTEALLREATILDLDERQRSGLPVLLHPEGEPPHEEMRR